MSDAIARRDFLRRTAHLVACAGTAGGLAAWLHNRDATSSTLGEGETRDFRLSASQAAAAPRMAIARGQLSRGGAPGTAPETLTRAAIEAMGGMARFISRGDVVVIKPNIGWASLPRIGANTHPAIVAELVRLCHDAGAKRVVVTDVSCNDYKICFSRSGIRDAARAAAATVIEPVASKFRQMTMRGTEILKRWLVFKPIVECDKVINVPVAKHHNLSRYTGAMKNWYGVLGGTRNQLHQAIDVSIADLATFVRPTLTVLDATRVIVRNGPQGGSLKDVVEKGIIAAATDEVAIDAFGASLLGLSPKDVPYLGLGAERGLGTADFAKLNPVERKVG